MTPDQITDESEIISLSVEVRIRYKSSEGRLAAIRLARRSLWIDASSTECDGIGAKTERGLK